jgi:hypothetical protein
LSRVECESDYEEPEDDEGIEVEPEAKQKTDHVMSVNKYSKAVANKWRRATDAAMSFRVFLKRQVSEEHDKECCDIMKNTVLPLAKETRWLEDISAEDLELTRAEEERETFNEEKMADNSYVNSERGEFSFEALTSQVRCAFFSGQKK